VKKELIIGRVGVLFGGTSAEREVSLEGGRSVYEALRNAGINAVAIDLQCNEIEQIKIANIDAAFIMLHGGMGENGNIQALLDFMKIPYTGSGTQASAVAMNKIFSKQIWQGIGLPTPKFCVLKDDSDWSQVLAHLGGNAIIKPASEGSSIGMSIANSVTDLKKSYQVAKQYDNWVFAEELLTGPEYTIAIVNNRALPVIKLETDNDFYDYEAKYISSDTRYICPCGLSLAKEEEIKTLALWAFNSLQCRGWGRVDVMEDSDGFFKVLEVNTVPGMTSHSLVPMAARAEGLTMQDLVVQILSGISQKVI
jgi:D-alanine-D-alanine ligase